MNKKAEVEDLLKSYLVYFILLVIFVSGMFYFIYQQREGADVWANYYSNEMAKVIDFMEEGDSICLDVHKASEIAEKNEVGTGSEIFEINNIKNEVCVKFSKGIKRCTNYFNNVEIVNLDFKLATYKDKKFVNTLCFNAVKSGGIA